MHLGELELRLSARSARKGGIADNVAEGLSDGDKSISIGERTQAVLKGSKGYEK